MFLRKRTEPPKKEPRNYSKDPAPLHWKTKDLFGHGLPEIKGIVVCSPNNWMRAMLYKFGASRRMTRRV